MAEQDSNARALAGLHITLLTASASRLGGGVATAVQVHSEMLRQAGAKVTVVALKDAHSEEDRALLGEATLETVPIAGPAFFGYAPQLLDRLLATGADILHLHGIWMYPSRAATLWARRTGKPYVISPHGMLDPWITSRGRWKKALARRFYERASWREADAFHALTSDEAADIAREAGDRPILTIPNAGPLPVNQPAGSRPPRVVYLGRIHQKKNIAALVEAWQGAVLPAEADLVIVGWGTQADVAALQAQLAKAPRSVRFIGEAHGDAKQELLQSARFVILPSHSEGLPMTILEAWAAGTPTIMTSACHLPEGFAAGAAIECATDAGSIAAAITKALAMDEAGWQAASSAALRLARDKFSTESVLARWIEAYRGLAAAAA